MVNLHRKLDSLHIKPKRHEADWSIHLKVFKNSVFLSWIILKSSLTQYFIQPI